MSSNSNHSRSFHRLVQAISVVSLLLFAGMLHLHEVPAYHHWWTFCIWGSLEEKLREKAAEMSLIREEIEELHRIIEVRDERERLVSENEPA